MKGSGGTPIKVKEFFLQKGDIWKTAGRLLGFVALSVCILIVEYIMLYKSGMEIPFTPVFGESSRNAACMVTGTVLTVCSAAAMFAYLKTRKTEMIALALILFSGVLIAVFSPVMNGFDELSHFFKSVATLDGKMLDYESYNYEISDSYILLRDRQLETLLFSDGFNAGWMKTGTYVEALYNGYAQPTYPFYGYIFCCMGLLIARLLHLSTGLCFLFGRLFNLFGYAGFIYIAFKLLPKEAKGFRAVMLLYACMPGNLFVAAHYSQDSVVYGIVAVITALFVRMYFADRVARRDFILFGVLFLLLVPLKFPYIILGFLLLLIPREKYGFKKPYLWIALLAVISVVIAGVWVTPISTQHHEPRVENVDGAAQIAFMLRHIPTFVRTAVYTFMHTLSSYMANTMRLSGAYNLYASSGAGIVFSVLSIVFSVLYMGRTKIDKKVRIFIAIMIIAIAVGITVALYASYNTVGESVYIKGVQARYFYPLFLLIPLALSGKAGFTGEKELVQEAEFTGENRLTKEAGSLDVTCDLPALVLVLAEVIWFCFGFLIFYV